MTIFTHMTASAPNHLDARRAYMNSLEKTYERIDHRKQNTAADVILDIQLLHELMMGGHSALSKLTLLRQDWKEWRANYNSCRQLLEHRKQELIAAKNRDAAQKS